MKFNCECGRKYEMLAVNTNIYTYTAESKYNWFETECPGCKVVSSVFFFDDPDGLLAVLRRVGCSNTRKALAEDQVKAYYDQLYGEDPVETYDLTPRQEAEIAALAAELADTPDEWIQEVFSTPPPKSDMPMRWT